MGCVVNITPRPFYPRERPGTHCTGGWVGHLCLYEVFSSACWTCVYLGCSVLPTELVFIWGVQFCLLNLCLFGVFSSAYWTCVYLGCWVLPTELVFIWGVQFCLLNLCLFGVFSSAYWTCVCMRCLLVPTLVSLPLPCPSIPLVILFTRTLTLFPFSRILE